MKLNISMTCTIGRAIRYLSMVIPLSIMTSKWKGLAHKGRLLSDMQLPPERLMCSTLILLIITAEREAIA